jgi:hypothetical protein
MLQRLIHSVMVTACRHGQIYLLQNCYSGERHAYAIVAFWLMLVAGLTIQCWFYDINCR